MIYYTDKINVTKVTVDPVTGSLTKATPSVKNARVETYNSTILMANGKQEKADYLIFTDDDTITEGDLIEVTSVMGRSVSKKSYDVKKSFYAGGFGFCQMELYV